jgi:hypothetical protein
VAQSIGPKYKPQYGKKKERKKTILFQDLPRHRPLLLYTPLLSVRRSSVIANWIS